MRHTAWQAVRASVLASAILGGGAATASARPEINPDSAVRSNNVVLLEVIAEASEQSPTFHGMIDQISALKGIVYIVFGDCGHGVRACLVHVVPAGALRFLWVKVDSRKSRRELMGSIGHELRHAIEVLNDRSVRTTIDMNNFYDREASMRGIGTFETYAAIAAGDAVRKELRGYVRD